MHHHACSQSYVPDYYSRCWFVGCALYQCHQLYVCWAVFTLAADAWPIARIPVYRILNFPAAVWFSHARLLLLRARRSTASTWPRSKRCVNGAHRIIITKDCTPITRRSWFSHNRHAFYCKHTVFEAPKCWHEKHVILCGCLSPNGGRVSYNDAMSCA